MKRSLQSSVKLFFTLDFFLSFRQIFLGKTVCSSPLCATQISSTGGTSASRNSGVSSASPSIARMLASVTGTCSVGRSTPHAPPAMITTTNAQSSAWPDSPAYWLTSTAQNRGLPKPNVILETPQRELATQALINSDLLGFQPRNAKAVRTGQLAVISEVRVARMRATGMVWRKNRQIPSGLHFIMETARAFIADRDAGMEPSDSLEHER